MNWRYWFDILLMGLLFGAILIIGSLTPQW